MSSRSQITELLNQLEHDLKELEITYEQYFLGIEKRAPDPQRQKISQGLRRLLNKYIPQTDLKFRLRGLSSRFYSYCGYWDRILRLIDEGRYQRHTSRLQRTAQAEPAATFQNVAAEPVDPLKDLYNQLVEAHSRCALQTPSREQVAAFLARQEATIREKFGDQAVEYLVVTEGGRPKIKVRARD